jgi:hypothetical protein
MRPVARLVIAAGCLTTLTGAAFADEAAFLRSLDGNWAGGGTVKVRTSAPTIRVSCKFASETTADSLALDGTCRGLLVFSRRISADLKANGARYAGYYIGAGTGPAGLSGRRSGNAINLNIRWAKKVNGDRKAKLIVEKNGSNGMRLTTTDVDPKTGESVVTSRIDLKRR